RFRCFRSAKSPDTWSELPDDRFSPVTPPAGHRKDEILDALARGANVAQFVSFSPGLAQSHSRVRGFPPDHRFASPEEAVAVLLDRTPERSVNVRSFNPDSPKSRELLYGRTEA